MPTPKPRTQTPTAQARTQIVNKLVAMGYRGQDLAAIIRAGRTRGQMAVDLVAAQRQAPKGKV